MKDLRIELGSNPAICQKWEEFETNWGVRPDGFSLHRDFDALERFVRAYWDEMPKTAPPEYSYPDGLPYPVGVDDNLAGQLSERDGLRFWSEYETPGSGGLDGWKPIDIDDFLKGRFSIGADEVDE